MKKIIFTFILIIVSITTFSKPDTFEIIKGAIIFENDSYITVTMDYQDAIYIDYNGYTYPIITYIKKQNRYANADERSIEYFCDKFNWAIGTGYITVENNWLLSNWDYNKEAKYNINIYIEKLVEEKDVYYLPSVSGIITITDINNTVICAIKYEVKTDHNDDMLFRDALKTIGEYIGKNAKKNIISESINLQ